jgi:hypothetical protein
MLMCRVGGGAEVFYAEEPGVRVCVAGNRDVYLPRSVIRLLGGVLRGKAIDVDERGSVTKCAPARRA